MRTLRACLVLAPPSRPFLNLHGLAVGGSLPPFSSQAVCTLAARIRKMYHLYPREVGLGLSRVPGDGEKQSWGQICNVLTSS